MPKESENVMQAMKETRDLLAQAERTLTRAKTRCAHVNAHELEHVLRDIRMLYNRTLALTADVNRRAIDKFAQTRRGPRNWPKQQ